VENEIDTMITSKRLEQRIMCIMPFAIVAYLRLTNGTYISGMYGNLPGIIAMTICLIVIAVSGLWGKKIVNIEV
jgi:tight adherence protein B